MENSKNTKETNRTVISETRGNEQQTAGGTKLMRLPGIQGVYSPYHDQTSAADCRYPLKMESRTFPIMRWVALVSTTLVKWV